MCSDRDRRRYCRTVPLNSSRGFPAESDSNTLQGLYGEDYVRAVASAWGVAHGTVDARDLIKADVSLTLRGEHGGFGTRRCGRR